MAQTSPFYLSVLQNELQERCARNPRYSLRAFAKAVSLDPGTLSRVLSGQSVPSLRMSKLLIDKIGLTPMVREQFLSSVAKQQRGRQLMRVSPWLKTQSDFEPAVETGMDLFRLHSEWYHAAILELTFTKGFKSDARWIAKRLGISAVEAKLAVQRLLDFGLLSEKNGEYRKTSAQITTADKHITHAGLKRGQQLNLEKAIASLQNDPIEARSMTTMTMAISSKKMPEAKKLIQEFNRRMCDLLETGTRDSVYNLQISLFPVAHAMKEHKK